VQGPGVVKKPGVDKEQPGVGAQRVRIDECSVHQHVGNDIVSGNRPRRSDGGLPGG